MKSLTAFGLTLTMLATMVTAPSARGADIVTTAVEAGSFKTLAAAVKAAGLVETLQGKGPFTVFAPTDEAFAKLPKGTLESLLKPENKDKLTAILTYHVVGGNVTAADVVKLDSAKTVQGQSVRIRVKDGKVMINDAVVTTTDIQCDNGVIHVIDSVLLPPKNSEEMRQALQGAVHQGAHLFNAGHHQACADLYHTTLGDMMPSLIDEGMKHHVTTVMATASSQHCQTTRAWTLRRGIDQMYTMLSSH